MVDQLKDSLRLVLSNAKRFRKLARGLPRLAARQILKCKLRFNINRHSSLKPEKTKQSPH